MWSSIKIEPMGTLRESRGVTATLDTPPLPVRRRTLETIFLFRTFSDIFGHPIATTNAEAKDAEKIHQLLHPLTLSPCHCFRRDISGHSGTSSSPRLGYSLCKEHRGSHRRRDLIPVPCAKTHTERIPRIVPQHPLGGQNMPAFSAISRCFRPGLEMGEKKDLGRCEFRFVDRFGDRDSCG